MPDNSIPYWGKILETPQLTQLNPLTAAYVYSLSQSPEEETLTKILEYAKTSGLTQKKLRLFGRNIYPTDKPEPHGYEYYLTSDSTIKTKGEVVTGEVSGGLYAVLEIKNLLSIGEGWQKLFSWVEANGHLPVGVSRGKYGWVNSAFEELLDWHQQKPPNEWCFCLWVQIRE
jgi:DNA gyrase inhibitor GyrI